MSETPVVGKIEQLSDPTPENLRAAAAAFDIAYKDRFPNHFPHHLSGVLRAAADRIQEQEQHITTLEQRIAELEAALTYISEYWNRDNNEKAMTDALWATIEIAQEALSPAPPTAQGEQL